MAQQQRLTQIENIRTLAILLVVLGHSIILYSSDWNLYETTRQVPFFDWIKKIIDIIQMPLFFSISGYLFVLTHRRKRIRKLVKDKWIRLMVPYLGIGFLWMLPIRIGVRYKGYENNSVIDIILKFLTANDVGHLWFLPALFLSFLLSEVLLSIVECIPVLKNFGGIILLFTGGVLYLQGYRIGFRYGPLLSAFNYLIWFALGYCLNIYKMYVQNIYKINLIKKTLVWANVLLLCYVMNKDSICVMISNMFRAMFIINVYEMIPEKTCNIIQRIDRNSFGIYLFHSPLVYITFFLYKKHTSSTCGIC